ASGPQNQRDNRQRQQHHPGDAERRLRHRMPRLSQTLAWPAVAKAAVNPLLAWCVAMMACNAGAGVTNRTKWMRLSVRDLGDVIRWAGAQNVREIGEFRYRVVNGREIVSFRLVPRYAIDIGAREIIVVAYARLVGWRAKLRDFRRIAGVAG